MSPSFQANAPTTSFITRLTPVAPRRIGKARPNAGNVSCLPYAKRLHQRRHNIVHAQALVRYYGRGRESGGGALAPSMSLAPWDKPVVEIRLYRICWNPRTKRCDRGSTSTRGHIQNNLRITRSLVGCAETPLTPTHGSVCHSNIHAQQRSQT